MHAIRITLGDSRCTDDIRKTKNIHFNLVENINYGKSI